MFPLHKMSGDEPLQRLVGTMMLMPKQYPLIFEVGAVKTLAKITKLL